MKFVHAADLHIDSPLKGLSSYPGAPVEELRGATRKAFESLVDLCLEQRVDLLVIAGDLYDVDWKDFSTGLYVRSQLGRLRSAGIEVVIVRGNHDAENVITRGLKLPGIHVLNSERPQSIPLEGIGVAVHGQSFARRAITENLARTYPQPVPGLFNIGVLHTSLSGYAAHETYAPCSLAELVEHGYEYWALGHVHERAVLHTRPYVVYPGNLQGRHMRECGPKGVTVVEVDDDEATLSSHTLDHVRFEHARVDVGGVQADTEVLELGKAALESALEDAQGRLVACRMEVAGVTAVHGDLVRDRERLDAELRSIATDVASEQVWLERVTWKTTPVRGAIVSDDAIGETVKVLRHAADDCDTLDRLAERMRPLAVKLPREVREGPDGIDPTDPATLQRLLAEVERTLPSLVAEGRSS